MINLGVSLPNAPANVGSYQLFCVLGLSIFQIEKSSAAGFSNFAFLALTIPIAIVGFGAFLRSGLTLRHHPRTNYPHAQRTPQAPGLSTAGVPAGSFNYRSRRGQNSRSNRTVRWNRLT